MWLTEMTPREILCCCPAQCDLPDHLWVEKTQRGDFSWVYWYKPICTSDVLPAGITEQQHQPGHLLPSRELPAALVPEL